MMRQAKVPFIPSLESMDSRTQIKALEECGSVQSIDQVNWEKLYPYKPITSVTLARSESALYLYFTVNGNCLRAVNSQNNTPVWEDSCVEFFAQLEEETEYYNFEFNCIGTTLAAKRKSKEEFTLMEDAQIERIQRYSSLPNKPFKEMSGIFAWELLVAIPFDLLGLNGENLPSSMRANFYKCADATELPHYVSWSPIALESPNFHVPAFFGELQF